MIPFNKPHLAGNEISYIQDAVNRGKISGNGYYTKKCHEFFRKEQGFNKCLLTSSCTDALEMAAILCDIMPGDEVIIPSFTFVSTANAFILRGAKIVFADSRSDHPGLDEDQLEELISPHTKVIVPVHYAGVACNMNKIMALAKKYNLIVVEDAAQCIDSFYEGKPLGSIGHLGCFSFHETKNIQCGEGGMLAINDSRFSFRSEIIWEKGTNRAAFWRGEIDKYGWVDLGSSFLPSEIQAAFLFAQLEQILKIQEKRKELWQQYFENLISMSNLGFFKVPFVPEYSSQNAHMFYIICKTIEERTNLIAFLQRKSIQSVFHYQSLHKSIYYKDKHDGRILLRSDHFTDCLLRLPFYNELSLSDVTYITESINEFYKSL